MKKILRYSSILLCFMVLFFTVPLHSLAVDPVSSAVMANAMAQAITAYGASQGVSMTFDVANTDGIGESVKDLWDDYAADLASSDVPTYDSFAVTLWSNLYSKIGDKIGINISAENMGFIDGFWNWLLSGPAEMTKVDNQYYEWTVSQSGIVDPIVVISYSPFGSDLPNCDGMTYQQMFENGRPFWRSSSYGVYSAFRQTTVPTNMSYLIATGTSGNVRVYAFSLKENSSTVYYNFIFGGSYRAPSVISQGSEMTYNGHIYKYGYTDRSDITDVYIPIYSTLDDAIAVLDAFLYDGVGGESISVQPYVGDAVPQDVYIPDNNDVNYSPVDVAIPLDINWDPTLFGDGDGVLTDAQSTSISGVVDNSIVSSVDGTLTLADTANPDIPAPNEVYIPLLPVTLPNFNFSFSGIWHYVVSWVQSLGSWFSMVFTVWSNLPYAIVLPVYATAVVVIIIGTLKRFL